ncbi:MAG: hypothetical protein ACRYHQ_08285 [Janthinobacterium lividum]
MAGAASDQGDASSVEDAAEAHDVRRHGYHAYNAVLRRVLCKGHAEMGSAELEAAVAWLGRNRLRDHLGLLDGDTRHAWDVERRSGGWKPPVGRTPKVRYKPLSVRAARDNEE